jgi:two-component system, NtrC family, response regulator GlrR
VTDLRMHGMDRMALFDAIHRDSPALPVVILTAGASPLPPPESCCSM